MQVRYLFVTGGVLSSLGKGITAASIGNLLEHRGYKIAMIKLDPYLNVDPGTMNPFQHGEVYVMDDGAETDLDLGHYYRYTNSPLSKASSATSGQIYETVLRKEREGVYLGETVQVIPHITDEIKRRVLDCAHQEEGIEIVIVEIGGTVGDIESLPHLEAIRQFRHEREGFCFNIHLTYVPFLKAAGEVKTKPTQHSVQELRAIGIAPDVIVCRSESPLSEEIKSKISLFCNVAKDAVIDEPDVIRSIYEVPIHLSRQKIDEMILEKLNLPSKKKGSVLFWQKALQAITYPKKKVTIGIVGKYIEHQDAYKSIFEALRHSAIHHEAELEIKTFDSDKIAKKHDSAALIEGCDGYLVPGGFGERGWLGKLITATHCRENKIPYFGICLGMQIMAIEFARNVLLLEGAHTTEIDEKTPHPIISLLEEQKEIEMMGGSMRLGAFPCSLTPQSKAFEAYGNELIHERHRHRYEFNSKYTDAFEKHGCMITGTLPEKGLVEILEIKDHPWMVGTQFHPEFKSKPESPHPLFNSFLLAAIQKREKHG